MKMIPTPMDRPLPPQDGRPIPCFHSAGEFFSLLATLLFRHLSVKLLRPANRLLPDFREKLNLAVTGINKSGQFSFIHTKTAIEKGVKISEVKRLLAGQLDTFPEDETAALLYAKHWAETRGDIDRRKRQTVIAFFGLRETRLLEAVIISALFATLCSNTAIAHTTGTGKSSAAAYLLSSPFAWFTSRAAAALQHG